MRRNQKGRAIKGEAKNTVRRPPRTTSPSPCRLWMNGNHQVGRMLERLCCVSSSLLPLLLLLSAAHCRLTVCSLFLPLFLLFAAAESARDAFSTLDARVSKLTTKMEALQKSLEASYGPQGEFMHMEGQCFPLAIKQYIYEVSFFSLSLLSIFISPLL